MTLDELIALEREEAFAEAYAAAAEQTEFKDACALLEAMPNITSAEELSRLLNTPLELARKAVALRNSGDPRQSGDASGDKLPE